MEYRTPSISGDRPYCADKLPNQTLISQSLFSCVPILDNRSLFRYLWRIIAGLKVNCLFFRVSGTVSGKFFHIETGIIFGKPFGQVVKEALEVYVIPMPAEVPVDNFGQFLRIFLGKHDYPSFFS